MLRFSENFKYPGCVRSVLWHVESGQCLQDPVMPLQFYSTDLAFIFAVGWILGDADIFFLFFN
jgi:hypothetical protein